MSNKPPKIQTDLTFGIDLGNASCGWAVVNNKEEYVLGLGSWCWRTPELATTGGKRSISNKLRRSARLQRRTLRRRVGRLHALRELFAQYLHTSDFDFEDPNLVKNISAELRKNSASTDRNNDPWKIRADAVALNIETRRKLSALEWIVVLYHMAKHRGANLKDYAESSDENDKNSRKVKTSLRDNAKRIQDYPTFGTMLATDSRFDGKKRNKTNKKTNTPDYSHTPRRDWINAEAKKIFEAQRALNNPLASTEFEEKYLTIAFDQKPLQDSKKLVGKCAYIKQLQRAAQSAPSFERFQLLHKLSLIELTDAENGTRHLSATERAHILKSCLDLEEKENFTEETLRRILNLAPSIQIAKFQCPKSPLKGTRKLKEILGDYFNILDSTADYNPLDNMAFALSFCSTPDSLSKDLKSLSLPNIADDIREQIIDKLHSEDFKKIQKSFKYAGHLSAKAARELNRELLNGLSLEQACDNLGYQVTHQRQVTTHKELVVLLGELENEITHPVARKAISEGLKQIFALIKKYGLPNRIHIETLREVGKTEKQKATEFSENLTRKQKNDDLRKKFKEDLGRDPENHKELEKFKLAQECGGVECIYCSNERPTHPHDYLRDWEIEHIIPRSLGGGDGLDNKTLACPKCNRDKGSQLPYPWIKNDPDGCLDKFLTNVNNYFGNQEFKRKRQNLLAQELPKGFAERDKNAASYAAKILMEKAAQFYPPAERNITELSRKPSGKRHIFAQAGFITGSLRRYWGLNRYKKDNNNQRIEDNRHHALDALIIAATTEGVRQNLIQYFKAKENLIAAKKDDDAHGTKVAACEIQKNKAARLAPWTKNGVQTLQNEWKKHFNNLVTARGDNPRGRKELHAANYAKLYESENISKIKNWEYVLDNLAPKNPDHIPKLKRILTEWLQSDRLQPPKWKQWDITNIRYKAHAAHRFTDKKQQNANIGNADRLANVRADIFAKTNKKARTQYFMVPIKAIDLAWRKENGIKIYAPIPLRTTSSKCKNVDTDPDVQFLFSLYKDSFVKLNTSDKTKGLHGYVSLGDITEGKIKIMLPNQVAQNKGDKRVGIQGLQSFEKYKIDRFGKLHCVKNEKRTWHDQVQCPECRSWYKPDTSHPHQCLETPSINKEEK